MNIYSKAVIKGSVKHPEIIGYAAFIPSDGKTMVSLSVYALPKGSEIFAVHLHEGTSCTGNSSDPFANTKSHYDTAGSPHPYHTGDLPPIFSEDGTSRFAFLTGKFTPEEIIGKTVVIHAMPDDFHSQPSGNSGEKIACGVIEKM